MVRHERWRNGELVDVQDVPEDAETARRNIIWRRLNEYHTRLRDTPGAVTAADVARAVDDLVRMLRLSEDD